MCLLIHACLSCLLLLRVESGLIHRGWIRGVWTCPTVCELSVWTRFGKGSGERPCRSTWWVVSLQPSSGTEFCVCDPWFSYYHALGPEIWPRSTSYSPLSSVQELQVVSGVCSMLEAVDSADRRGGLWCGRHVAGYTGRPFGVTEPCSHRLGLWAKLRPDLLMDGTRIGDKPGLETWVFR